MDGLGGLDAAFGVLVRLVGAVHHVDGVVLVGLALGLGFDGDDGGLGLTFVDDHGRGLGFSRR
ncbi:hypothetical protein [Glycomyces tenuis]|uniref:hypothetical protein n=1 Tax=Glycomyces tenuis TaxID=58116 RepID=UPI00047A5D9D|nr:hypothetical protein [Glycomyces tenuis]